VKVSPLRQTAATASATDLERFDGKQAVLDAEQVRLGDPRPSVVGELN